MARMYPLNRFKPYDYKRECDICGWDYLRSELHKTWDGKLVCKEDFEPKHPREYPQPNFKQRPFRRE
jgi:hypothetical protein